MGLLIAFAFALLRLTGFFIEPLLSDAEIHAVAGEPSNITRAADAGRQLKVVTWNIERGLQFDRVAEVLASIDADVILLQEADRFCARSGGREVPRELAIMLKMNYVSGGEFQEIGEGARGKACVSGQAILSRASIDEPATLRFGEQASWKWKLNPAQPRRGGRIALRARSGGVTFYSVHLESGGDEILRANQLRDIASDADARDGSIIVGGDFNNEGGRDSKMFDPLLSASFVNSMARHAARPRRPIDWIYTKELTGTSAPVLVDASDHDPVVFKISVQRRF